MKTIPAVVCLTPVWNEAWILDRFLQGASTWADHIVIADQQSDDGSSEIARQHPKVTLVENTGGYDEGLRQRLLIDAARAITGPRVLVALDADESLTPNVVRSRDWREALSAPPGTALRMSWINLLPGADRAWVPATPIAFGFVDDERPHPGVLMHSARLPTDQADATLDLDDVAVLHYQYLDEQRMRAKQRWYQCFERVVFPDKRPAEIYRQYHHMDAWPREEVRAIDGASLGFPDGDAELEVVNGGQDVWHRRILDLMRRHGAAAFSRVDVWDVDWPSEAIRLASGIDRSLLIDPRGPLDRAVLRWLRFAQPRRSSAAIRMVSRSLEVVGW